MDYDFNGVSGFVGMQRDLPLDYPNNYRFDFRMRGDSPANDFQFKLIDASGDNVWWVNRPKYAFPKDWSEIRYKKRQIDKAWGPNPDRMLRKSARLEYTIYNQVGGKGSVCFDDLRFSTLPKQNDGPYMTKATPKLIEADSGNAQAAADGDPTTVWMANAADAALTLDLGSVREFGGLTLQWQGGDYASKYEVSMSEDGETYRQARNVVAGNGGEDWIALPESEARYIRIAPRTGPTHRFALAEVKVQPLAFAATSNDFIKSVAATAPRGWFPRGFYGEQPYWTIVGVDGGTGQGLIGEDGAIELCQGCASVVPYVISDDRLVTWADVRLSQSLLDDYLPIPTVDWTHTDFGLLVTAFVRGDTDQSQMIMRYKLTNTSRTPHDYVLALAVQPFQVNPPSQFLTTNGGVAPIHFLALSDDQIESSSSWMNIVAPDRGWAVFVLDSPDAVLATAFDQGTIAERLSKKNVLETADPHMRAAINDETGLASGALLYRMRLLPAETREIALYTPLSAINAVDAPSPLIVSENERPGLGFNAAASQNEVA
ncbi:MAG: discoidin domain-containing protein, partial [Luteimonas sp.]